MELSETEQTLYDFIKKEKKTTLNDIRGELGGNVVGALGKLKSLGLIEFEKEYTSIDKFRMKMRKFIVLKG